VNGIFTDSYKQIPAVVVSISILKRIDRLVMMYIYLPNYPHYHEEENRSTLLFPACYHIRLHSGFAFSGYEYID
jgi:hypothetical protein